MDMQPYDYWLQALPTYMGRWPMQLFEISIPTVMITLSDQERNDLLDMTLPNIEMQSSKDPAGIDAWWQERQGRLIKTLKPRLERAIKSVGGKAFFRLDSRSPKDSWHGLKHGFMVEDPMYGLRLLCDSVERVYEDLSIAKAQEREVFIAVRQWIEIKPCDEFRVIVHDGYLSISQYFHHEAWSPDATSPVEARDEVCKAISEFYDQHMHNLDLGDIVFDVMVEKIKDKRSVTLIEINPFSEFTDPCLFNWREDAFNIDEFRYRESKQDVVKFRF